MNTRNTVRWLLPLALCAQWAVAQENPPPPPPGGDRPPPPPGEMRRGNGEGPGRRGLGDGMMRERLREQGPGQGPGPRLLERPDGPPGGPYEGVRRYMAQLKEESPEKYDKLVKLQEEKPEEFRQMLRGHMMKELLKRKLEGFPEIREAIEKLPEERRAELGRRFMGMPDSPPDARPGAERGEHRGPPERFEKLRDLTHKAQKAATDEERAAAKADLLKAAGDAFDANIKERMEHLERMEQEIKRIRAELDEQKSHKEQMIKERIERTLERKADAP